MHFYNIGREEALNYDIDDFRKRITDALKLGHFGISGQIDLEDTDAKNDWQYRMEFRK